MFDARTLTKWERVFDLQMWAFGCDARHPGGNLFARRGLRRSPPPEGSALSSTWTDGEVSLSSLGVTVTREGRSLFVQRGPLGPQLRGQPVELLAVLAAWVLSWEAWVGSEVGATWRDESLSSRKRPAPWNASGLRDEWRSVRAAVSA